jgi:hypothetical protein
MNRFVPFRWLGFALVLVALTASVACGGPSSSDTEDDPATQDELRSRSVDLFKPTWAPLEVVPATLKGLVAWEIYLAKKGITVIGRSQNKKAKAIFVQLLNGETTTDMLAMQGSGYLVASDFRLDRNSKKNELNLLAAAIRKDLSASIQEPDFGGPVDAVPVAAVEDGGALPPIEEPAPVAVADADASADASLSTPGTGPAVETVVTKPCTRSVIKTILVGLRYVADVGVAVVGTAACPETAGAGCVAAAGAFADALYLGENYDQLTCKASRP